MKFLKKSIFCHFWAQSGKNLALTSFKCGISSYIFLKFPLRCLYNQVFPHVNMKKNIDNVCFFTFFTTLDLIWPKLCPKSTPTLTSFAGFQWKMLEDSININKFNWNLVDLKNICCPHGPCPRQKTFFGRNNINRS